MDKIIPIADISLKRELTENLMKADPNNFTNLEIDNNDYWEEIGQKCSVNTYNFWKDLKEQFKRDFILIKK